MTSKIRVGISSWADAALIEDGSFYPKKSMSAEARLRFYAQFFDTVEINSAYYAIPDPRNAQRWTERTPPGFLFNIKAYALLTGHHPRVDTLPAEVQAALPERPRLTHRGEIDRDSVPPEAIELTFALYRASLEPLAAAGKLGYVLFQFAPWVRFEDAWLEYIGRLGERLPDVTVAVEFRHRSWFPEHASETLAMLRTARLAHVIVDGPTDAGAIPRVPVVTAPTAVLRLHGRNAEGWRRQVRGEDPAVREKYDYLYTDVELSELVPEIESLAGDTEQVVISFNNNNRAYPVRNALMMKRLLGQPASEPPRLASTIPDLFR